MSNYFLNSRVCMRVLLGMLWLWLCMPVHAETWQMQVGDMRVLTVPGLVRVGVGDGHVVSAVTTEQQEVIIFARNEGSSSVQVWQGDGTRHAYQIDVLGMGKLQHKHELKQLLDKIPGVEISEVGDKLVVQATHLTDGQQQQLAELAKRYPQLLDLSDSQGWDAMVLLDVQVVEVPRSTLKNLGTSWDSVSEGGMRAGAILSSAGLTGYFGVNALLSARIHALSEVGAATILAQPQLVARSGSTAEFLAGGEVPYTVTDGKGHQSTQFKSYGVSLKITPFIHSSGAVRSRIEVEVSAVDPTLSVPSGPSLKTRRAVTEFNVMSGQTLILAGFISKEISRNLHHIPGLGQLPLVGALFGTERAQHYETELAIFVTPYLVDAEHPMLQQRVHAAQALVAQQFPRPARLNTMISAEAYAPSQRPQWALPVQPLHQFMREDVKHETLP